MIELLNELAGWAPATSGTRCAVATVVGASGSVPRPVGTSMLVAAAESSGLAPMVLGSLSGGCVDGAVVAAALDALDDGVARLERFGYSAEDAFAVGLTCGGELEVHLQPLPPESLAGLSAVAGRAASSPFAVVRRLAAAGERADDGAVRPVVVPEPCLRLAELAAALGPLFEGDSAAAFNAASLVAPVLAQGVSAVVPVEPDGGCSSAPSPGPIRLLVESRLPAPRLLVVGANDFGAALVPPAKLLGYRVTLVDARAAFAAQERFAAADDIAVAWPHEYLEAEAAAGRLDRRTALCVLSHDPKFDAPLLDAALRLDLAYVGAMGSRRSHEQRIASLLQAGHGPRDLARLHSPIGLDLGAVTPAEVAVSILAELVASRNPAASGAPLRDVQGRIHGARSSARVRSEPTGSVERHGEPAWT